MVGHIRLAGLIAALLIIWLPSFALAQHVNFGVSPGEVRMTEVAPGNATEFELSISNTDEIAHLFTFTTFQPPKEERREGRAEFPDDAWIGFSSPQIEIAAGSQANVTVTVAIPQEQKWAGRDWEMWLGVTAESTDLLAAEVYVRLLVSTSGTRLNPGLFAGIAAATALLSYGIYYYFRRKARYE